MGLYRFKRVSFLSHCHCDGLSKPGSSLGLSSWFAVSAPGVAARPFWSCFVCYQQDGPLVVSGVLFAAVLFLTKACSILQATCHVADIGV